MPAHPTDHERFEALFRAHFSAVHRFLARRCTEPDELCAEVFATAWRRLSEVPAEEPLPWLYVTARHTLANRRRADARADDKRTRAANEPPAFGRDPAEALSERDHVLRAFASLRERDREALRLVAWDHLSLADAARVAGVPRAAFAVRVSRARRRLAAALAEHDAPAPATRIKEITS